MKTKMVSVPELALLAGERMPSWEDYAACVEGKTSAFFALPVEVAPHDLHVSRSGDLLRVRVAKRTERVSPDATPQRAA